jgi:hypothetical protein
MKTKRSEQGRGRKERKREVEMNGEKKENLLRQIW